MGLKCKLFGHEWKYYTDVIKHTTNTPALAKQVTIDIDKHFRFCGKCQTNQIRKNFTGKEYTDWDNCELTKEQLRDKKLKSLGI